MAVGQVRVPGSVPEVQAVETRPFKPSVVPVGQVHREVDMSAQYLKAGVVEPLDRAHVAGYRPDRQVLMAPGGSLRDYPLEEKPPDPPAAQTAGDHDRLDLATGPVVKQAREADNPAIKAGHPGRHPFRRCEIGVEGTPGIVASDGRVFVYPPVMLGQFRPQHPASAIVSRRVVADDKAGRGYLTCQLAVLHGDRVPVLRPRRRTFSGRRHASIRRFADQW